MLYIYIYIYVCVCVCVCVCARAHARVCNPLQRILLVSYMNITNQNIFVTINNL